MKRSGSAGGANARWANPGMARGAPAARPPLRPVGRLRCERSVRIYAIERPMIELIKGWASQINGCAFCIAMHTADAVEDGESHERLHTLNAWRETEFPMARERAALAWTEALTRIAPIVMCRM